MTAFCRGLALTISKPSFCDIGLWAQCPSGRTSEGASCSQPFAVRLKIPDFQFSGVGVLKSIVGVIPVSPRVEPFKKKTFGRVSCVRLRFVSTSRVFPALAIPQSPLEATK
jgi:hypothetical protein